MTRAFNFQCSRVSRVKIEIPQIFVSTSDDIASELLYIKVLSSQLYSHEGILPQVLLNARCITNSLEDINVGIAS